jgi:hypothetical protein
MRFLSEFTCRWIGDHLLDANLLAVPERRYEHQNPIHSFHNSIRSRNEDKKRIHCGGRYSKIAILEEGNGKKQAIRMMNRAARGITSTNIIIEFTHSLPLHKMHMATPEAGNSKKQRMNRAACGITVINTIIERHKFTEVACTNICLSILNFADVSKSHLDRGQYPCRQSGIP